MQPNTTRRGAVSLLLVVALPACYTHQPLDVPVPAPAVRIVATVSDSGTVAMSNAIGPGAVEVEGVVATADPNVWNLHLVRVDHRDGRSIPWNRELVSFPRSTLERPMERRLDRTRSWIFAGGVTVAAVLLGRLFNVWTTDGRDGGEPIPQESVMRGGGTRE